MDDFEPVQTIDDFQNLEEGEILVGYLDGFSGRLVQGKDVSRSYWHGWRNGMIESGRLPIDSAYKLLATAFDEYR